MTAAEASFQQIGATLKEATPGQLFGKACYKTGGKAFICFFEQAMVFKLAGKLHTEALSLEGAKLFDPSGKGRPMKEWVQVPFTHEAKWAAYAKAAKKYTEDQL